MMKIRNISEQLIYLPNKKEGLSLFEGIPYPSKAVYDLIGVDGVDYLSIRLKELIEMRKELFGNGKDEYFGMNHIQRFYDLKNKTFLKVEEIIDNNEKYTIEIDNNFLYSITKMSNIQAFHSIKKGGFNY